MNLIIKPEAQEQFSVTIEETETLGDLIEEIARHLNQEADNFRLVYRGRVLLQTSIELPLRDLNISDGDSIEVLTNLRPSRPGSESTSSRPQTGFSIAGHTFTHDLGPEVVGVTVNDENGSPVIRNLNQPQAEDLNAFREAMEHIPNEVGSFFGNLFGQIFNQRPEQNAEQQQSTAETRDAEQQRPSTRRQERRVEPQNSTPAVADPPANDEIVAEVIRVQQIANEVMREILPGEQVINTCIEQGASAIRNEVLKLNECTTPAERNTCCYNITRLQTLLNRMLYGGNTHMGEIFAHMASDELDQREQAEALQRILRYLQ